jgi:hypothetical protein
VKKVSAELRRRLPPEKTVAAGNWQRGMVDDRWNYLLDLFRPQG